LRQGPHRSVLAWETGTFREHRFPKRMQRFRDTVLFPLCQRHSSSWRWWHGTPKPRCCSRRSGEVDGWTAEWATRGLLVHREFGHFCDGRSLEVAVLGYNYVRGSSGSRWSDRPEAPAIEHCGANSLSSWRRCPPSEELGDPKVPKERNIAKARLHRMGNRIPRSLVDSKREQAFVGRPAFSAPLPVYDRALRLRKRGELVSGADAQSLAFRGQLCFCSTHFHYLRFASWRGGSAAPCWRCCTGGPRRALQHHARLCRKQPGQVRRSLSAAITPSCAQVAAEALPLKRWAWMFYSRR